MLKLKPEINQCEEERSPIKVEDFTVIMGMAGQVSGQLIFGFKEEIVKKIAEIMIEQEVTELDELTISAVAEFTNVMAGNSTIVLVEQGKNKKIGMSPPSIVQGKNMRISTKVKPINKFTLDFGKVGKVSLHVALKEKV
jgi:chemotaxis protein CheX